MRVTVSQTPEKYEQMNKEQNMILSHLIQTEVGGQINTLLFMWDYQSRIIILDDALVMVFTLKGQLLD